MCSNSVNSAHVIFEVNRTKIKGGCQSGRKVVTHDSKSALPLVYIPILTQHSRVGNPLNQYNHSNKINLLTPCYTLTDLPCVQDVCTNYSWASNIIDSVCADFLPPVLHIVL